MSEQDDIQALIKLLDIRLASDQTDLYRRALEQFDRVILRRALERCEGNLTRAAAMLGLSRVTLRSKLRALGLATGKTNATEREASDPDQSAEAGHHGGTNHPPSTAHSPPPNTPREVGQDVTRSDKPGAGFAEPHMGDPSRREAAPFPNRMRQN
jgi:DNA-binding protein Fis